MIFRRITLENFGIFYGSQGLELELGLYVLHGENGRGKTTILNAVKWAFFGAYSNRQGRTVNPDVIINQDARREGTRKFSVTLLLEDERGIEILVRRTCELTSAPEISLYVELDGKSLNQAAAQHLLRNLLSERIARFFLFDGEQLREYEELLFEEEESARLVKASIEQILGLPVLENAINDLGAVADEIGKRIARAARRNEKTRQQGLQAQQLESEIKDAEEDLADLKQHKADAERAILEAEAVLQKYESSQDILKEIEAIETELEGISEMKRTAAEDRAKALADSWRDVLFRAVAPKRTHLEETLSAQRQAELDARAVVELRSSLDKGTCVLCGQGVAGDAAVALESRLDQMEQAAEPGTGDGGPDVHQSLLALAGINETGRLQSAVEFDERIAELDARAATKRQELQQVRESVQDVPEDDIRAAAEKRDRAQQDLGQINHLVHGKEEDISNRRATLQDVLREIAGAGDSVELTALREKEQLARDLADLCETARARYRDSLRERVEQDASDIFMRLTTEPSHAGLRINENYGLETIGSDGEVVPGRSAGQEQIVALSLIGALNRNAARRAPVMMDTPFGRLDEKHRAKVLAFLADMANQVFLLVHSAEVAREDLDNIAADISAEFELHRTAAFRTEFLPLDQA